MRIPKLLVLPVIAASFALSGCQSQSNPGYSHTSTASRSSLAAGDELGLKLFAEHEPAPETTADTRQD